MDSIERAHFDINTLLPSSDSRYFSPEEIDSGIYFAIVNLFNQQYKVFGETQRISDDLARFKTTTPIPLVNGIGPMPQGHVYTLSVYGTKIGTTSVIKRCRIVEEQFIAQYIDSEAFAPDQDNLIARLVGPNIQVYPNVVTELGMTYFRKPNPPKFAYTLTGLLNNIPVYDPLNSIQLDYSDITYNQIIEKALTFLGVAQKDQVDMTQESLFRQAGTPEAR